MKDSNKFKHLLINLLEKDYNVDDLSKSLSLSQERLQKHIFETNQFYGLPLINLQQGNVSLDYEILECSNSLIKAVRDLETINYDKEIRKKIYLILLLLKDDYLPIESLMDVTHVSKNTVVSDIRELRQTYDPVSINIPYNRQEGYTIIGDELDLRGILVSTLTELLELRNGILILSRSGLFDFGEIDHLRSKMEFFEKKFQMSFTDERIRTLPFHLYAVIERVRRTHINLEQFYDLKGTEEYLAIEKIFWDFEFLHELDLLYLTFLVMSANVIKGYNLAISKDLEGSTEKFINEIEKDIAIQFEDKIKVKNDLISHLRPVIFRSKLHLHVINGIADTFIERYGFFYEVVKKHIAIFNPIFKAESLSKDEIVLIAMIVMGNISKVRNDLTPFTGIVVCKNGKAISHLLAGTLNQLFPNINITKAMSKRQFENEAPEVDFVFTTIPIRAKAPSFLVSPLLSNQEQELLKKKVGKRIQSDSKLKAREIIFSITSLIPEENQKDVLEALKDFFSQGGEKPSHSLNLLHSLEQITILEEEVSWKDIITRSFQAILNRGSITGNYIEKCKEQFYSAYATQIISREVLLPHSVPENGVIKPDVQIVLLEQPVISPKGENYHMVVALAPGHKNEHVSWLVEFNKRLRKETTRNKILNAKTEQELYERLVE